MFGMDRRDILGHGALAATAWQAEKVNRQQRGRCLNRSGLLDGGAITAVAWSSVPTRRPGDYSPHSTIGKERAGTRY